LERAGQVEADHRRPFRVGGLDRVEPGGGLLRVDMDPLVVAGGLGEQVDLLLGDLPPAAVAQDLTDCRQQLTRTRKRPHTLILHTKCNIRQRPTAGPVERDRPPASMVVLTCRCG
jgi:hypothetical protein